MSLVLDERSQPQVVEKQMRTAAYDSRRLGVLVSVVRNELDRRKAVADSKQWQAIEANLRKAVDLSKEPEPLIAHLPSLPGHRDPLFLAWGFEYPGIIREPQKYLRKAM
jgi:hypothetical protein